MFFLWHAVIAHTHEIKTAPKTGYVNVEGGKLYYQIFGSGDPIILLHGGPGLGQGYLLPGMLELAKTHRVILYDQRGAGKSLDVTVNEQTITAEQFVKDLEALRKHLGVQKFTLMGHSFGGVLALHYANTYPNYLSSVVLINSGSITKEGSSAFIAEYNKRIAPHKKSLEKIEKSENFKKGDAAIIREFFRTTFSTYCYQTKDADRLTLEFTPASALGLFKILGLYKETKQEDLKSKVRQLRLPVLVIHGDHDPIPVWVAEEIKNTIPKAKLVILKNCGHFPYIEQSEILFSTIKEFLGQF